jgi:hypothetical protein
MEETSDQNMTIAQRAKIRIAQMENEKMNQFLAKMSKVYRMYMRMRTPCATHLVFLHPSNRPTAHQLSPFYSPAWACVSYRS